MEREPLALPPALRPLARSGGVEADTVGRSQARVIRAGSHYIKIGPAGSLERSARLQEVFSRIGMSRPLTHYETWQGRDYLAVEALDGKSGICWLDRPQWLAEKLGQAVRALHETDISLCPIRDVNERALALYEQENRRPCPGADALNKDVILHGDCCLPNVFFDENGFTGFIDLGEGGVGDRHFDLYWAQWSMGYNLKTDKYNARFLDAYGRDAVDPARMAVCTELK